MAMLCAFSASGTPTISITNEVQPIKILAEYHNVTLEESNSIYRIGVNIMNEARISFANVPQEGKEVGCALKYRSHSGAFEFLQNIDDQAVCNHIEFSLKHTYKLEGCPVTFIINSADKKLESVESSCDFRASLKTNPII